MTDYTTISPAGWPGTRVLRMWDVPWMDRDEHKSRTTIARAVACDLVGHKRWLNGTAQPVYTIYWGSWGDRAEYLGDDNDDWVRAKGGPGILRLGALSDELIQQIEQDLEDQRSEYPSEEDLVEDVAEDVAEWIYRLMCGTQMQEAADMLHILHESFKAGHIVQREHPYRTVARLIRDGYRAADVQRELAVLA